MAGLFSIPHITPRPLRILRTIILLLLGSGYAHSQGVVTTLDDFVIRGAILARGLDSSTMRAPDARPFAGVVISGSFMDAASVNIFTGVRLNRFGARLVGMLKHGHGEFAYMSGAEFDLLLNFMRRDHTSGDIFVGMGTETEPGAGSFFDVGPARRGFTSIGIAANMAGLYIGGEIMVRRSDTLEVRVLAQVGIAVEAGLKTIFDL